MRRALLPVAVLAACAALLGACGGGSDSKDKPTNRGGARNVDPRPTESVGDAVDRIRGAVTASGCDAVKGLLHSTYGDISSVACRSIRTQLGTLRDPHGASYKTGAVIDYRTLAGQHRVVVLALDDDGTYRIDFIADVPEQAVRTSKPSTFDRNAEQAVRAMQTGDCRSFLSVVSRTVGLGVGPDEEVCRRVSDVPFRRELVANRAARPVPLGGNAWVAFYKLRTSPDAYYTMVMERQTGPDGSPRYVLVNALPAQ